MGIVSFGDSAYELNVLYLHLKKLTLYNIKMISKICDND